MHRKKNCLKNTELNKKPSTTIPKGSTLQAIGGGKGEYLVKIMI